MENSELESRKQSVIKGITWRCLATFTTYLIAWGLTGETETAGKVAAVEFVLKFFIYYMHERFWVWFPAWREKSKPTNITV